MTLVFVWYKAPNFLFYCSLYCIAIWNISLTITYPYHQILSRSYWPVEEVEVKIYFQDIKKANKYK